MGWADFQVTQHYLASNGERTQRALRDLMP